MRKLDKTKTLVTIGDMTYVREVTKLICLVVCVYISSLTQFAYFLSLFELVSLLHILPTLLFIVLAYINYFYRSILSASIA